MLIEEMPISKTAEIFQKSSNRELSTWRMKFMQLFDKYFKRGFVQKVMFQKSGRDTILTREDLLAKYQHLVNEIKKRGWEYTCNHPIDLEIFKAGLWEINIPALGDLIVSEDHVTLSGAYIQAPRDAEEIDVIITKREDQRSPKLEKRIKDILKSKTGKEINIIYAPEGPQQSYIPVFDLVLRPKDDTRRVDVEDISKKIPEPAIEELKIIFTGTGEGKSERNKCSLLLEYGEDQFLIDANPDIQADDFPALKVILLSDDSGDKTDAKRIGNASNIMPVVRKIEHGDLTIEPFRIKKTGRRIYGYTITLNKAKIVYAPDFYLLPEKKLKGASLAILGGVAWKRPISKSTESGGHAAIFITWKHMKEIGIPTVFTNIGPAVDKNKTTVEKLGIPIAEDGQVITIDAQKTEKTFPIQKPEETDDTIRIPVGPECEVTATITIDADQGISALYCGKIKKVRTFLFDKRKKAWTMASAKAWIKEQKEKTEKALGEGQGVGGDRQGIGGTDICVCPKCGHEEEHKRGTACADVKCPECETPMVGKDEKKKVDKKLSEAQQKEYDEETERIRESAKTAKYPHKFKAAKFTHPNGHPRCLICGDEEMVDDNGKELPCTKSIAKFQIIKLDKKKQLVGGIIYEPDIVDVQGDEASKEEIEKAMHRFMEKYATDTNRIRIMHKGKKIFFPILESFIPEQDTKKGGEIVKAGSWWMQLKITNPEIWDRVEKGELKGFSLGGRSRA